MAASLSGLQGARAHLTFTTNEGRGLNGSARTCGCWPIISRLEAVERGELKRLMIFLRV